MSLAPPAGSGKHQVAEVEVLPASSEDWAQLVDIQPQLRLGYAAEPVAEQCGGDGGPTDLYDDPRHRGRAVAGLEHHLQLVSQRLIRGSAQRPIDQGLHTLGGKTLTGNWLAGAKKIGK